MKSILNSVVDSGVDDHLADADSRYIRFFNTVLIVFGVAQIPVLPLLVSLGLYQPLIINLFALFLLVIGFLINRKGMHLSAKILSLAVMTLNTAYFSFLIGSQAPTHIWLVPIAVLGLLTFKPAEWRWATLFIGLSLSCFAVFEYALIDQTPIMQAFADPKQATLAAQTSTLSAILLTLMLIGIMHQRFIISEINLFSEKAQSDRLLRAILPDEIAFELRTAGTTSAVRHEDVSLLFADIVGFTPLAASMPAEDVVAILADIFVRFDDVISQCGVEKIKTIGDAYMVAGGVPKYMPDHAKRLAQCALEMSAVMRDYNAQSGHELRIRIGLHRGPAVAGVIGTSKFTYDLWGETVNLASRLESSGEADRIHVSDHFRQKLEEHFVFEERGEVILKGVGPTRTHWLLHYKGDLSA